MWYQKARRGVVRERHEVCRKEEAGRRMVRERRKGALPKNGRGQGNVRSFDTCVGNQQ